MAPCTSGASCTFLATLREAKIKRAKLFESSDARQQIRMHDLRATFVTLSLANGKTEAWITDRTGHKSSQMIYGYKRAARTAAEQKQGELMPLNMAIPECPKAKPPAQGGPEGGPARQKVARIPAWRTTKSSMIRAGGPSRTRTGTILLSRDFKFYTCKRDRARARQHRARRHEERRGRASAPTRRA